MSSANVPRTRLVFDPKLWGGRDAGDNSQFWKEAEILSVYRTSDGEEVADVRFLHDGRESRGHFTEGMDHHAEFRARFATASDTQR